jgi:hypothetical protein
MLQGLYEEIYPRFLRTRLAGMRSGDGVGSHLGLKFKLEAIQEIRDKLKWIEGLLPEDRTMEAEQCRTLVAFLGERIEYLTGRINAGDDPIDDSSGGLECLVSQRGMYRKVLRAFEQGKNT